MTVSLTLEAVFKNILATGLLKDIYHSVTLQPRLENGGTSPAASVAGRFQYVGPDDTKGFHGYVRQIGAAEVNSKVAITSQKFMYNMKFPMRAVFFNHNEKRSFEDLTGSLTKAIINTPRVELIRFNPIREEVLKTEVPGGTFKFKTTTFYLSIDFFIFLSLQSDNCEQVLQCADLKNPYCSPV